MTRVMKMPCYAVTVQLCVALEPSSVLFNWVSYCMAGELYLQ